VVGSQTSATSADKELKLASRHMLNAPSPATSAKNKKNTAARCKRIERGCHI
jgi:hypothetical protein